MIFFTSDHHFGHRNIIQYSNRPFSSVDEMDQVLIEAWNNIVSPGDLVYHLGDLVFGNAKYAKEIIYQLNGQIKLLWNPWHHDRHWFKNFPFTLDNKVVRVDPIEVLEFSDYGSGEYPQVVVLCHYPLAIWDRRHYGAWHLHGHSHGRYSGSGLILDVGVDVHDYQPLSLENVAKIMNSKR